MYYNDPAMRQQQASQPIANKSATTPDIIQYLKANGFSDQDIQSLQASKNAAQAQSSPSPQHSSNAQTALGAAKIGQQAYKGANAPAPAAGEGTPWFSVGSPSYAGYLGAGLEGYNTFNTLNNDNMTGKEKASRAQQQIGLGVADVWTGGLASGAEALARKNKTTGKYLGKLDKLDQKTNPATIIGGSLLGGKDKEQMKRDAVRKYLTNQKAFGDQANDWTLENADGSSFDIGKDGGARLDDGRRYYELDMNNKGPVQGQAIGAVQPLAYLITGGDKDLATQFGGYFTNTIMQGAGGQNLNTAYANAKDKYIKSGFDTPDKAHAGIDELIKAGKIDPSMAPALHNGINAAFGSAPATASTMSRPTTPMRTNSSNQKKRRQRPQQPYQEQVYTPQIYAPTTTAPMGSPSPYGDGFAQSLANVYLANQGV